MFNSSRNFRITAQVTTYRLTILNENRTTIAAGTLTVDGDAIGLGGLGGLLDLYPEAIAAILRHVRRLADLRIRTWTGDIGQFVGVVESI